MLLEFYKSILIFDLGRCQAIRTIVSNKSLYN